MKNSLMFLVTSFALLFMGCRDEPTVAAPGGGGTVTPGQDQNWLISESEVFDGGPGKDGIPSVDNPKFIGTEMIDYMGNDDLVLAFTMGGETKAYTHPVLDWHEIVNDRIGGKDIAITYCPLTGTGSAWDRQVGGKTTTFGVSGLLYRNNIIPYDRESGSNWSQIRLECVQGPLKSTRVKTFPMVEMPWRTWKTMFPAEAVLSTETGFSRNYGRYPYGGYRTNNQQLLFPVGEADDRLPNKDRVLAVIINQEVKVYTFDSFKNGVTVIKDDFQGKSMIIVGSQPDNFIMAYEAVNGTNNLDYQPKDLAPGGIVMTDNQGSDWNIFGHAVNGPNAGTQLGTLDVCIGYWFSFGAFYDPEIY